MFQVRYQIFLTPVPSHNAIFFSAAYGIKDKCGGEPWASLFTTLSKHQPFPDMRFLTLMLSSVYLSDGFEPFEHFFINVPLASFRHACEIDWKDRSRCPIFAICARSECKTKWSILLKSPQSFSFLTECVLSPKQFVPPCQVCSSCVCHTTEGWTLLEKNPFFNISAYLPENFK